MGGLQVGPDSAGADPGPVSYDRGGENITITDANIVAGVLVTRVVSSSGRMKLNKEQGGKAAR